MPIPVFVEPLPGPSWRARSGEPLPFTAEGATRDEALQNLRQLIEDRLAGKGGLVSLEIPALEHSLSQFAGIFKDNAQFEEWQQVIAEYRRQADEGPAIPWAE